MTLPRLRGDRVALVPVSHPVAVAALAGTDLAAPLRALGLRAAAGWPHADTADALRPLAEHGAAGDDGGWLVTVAGEVVGDCGWRGGPDVTGDVEIGYGLAAPHRGHGLGTQAVGLLAAWAQWQPGVRQVVARVQVGNVSSRRLLHRLGFAEQPVDNAWVRCVRAEHPTSQANPIRGCAAGPR